MEKVMLSFFLSFFFDRQGEEVTRQDVCTCRYLHVMRALWKMKKRLDSYKQPYGPQA